MELFSEEDITESVCNNHITTSTCINYLIKLSLTCSGTVGFMAPEVMKREHYTFTADWYSFGCLCCQLVNWYVCNGVF